jgi:hypothetical protein
LHLAGHNPPFELVPSINNFLLKFSSPELSLPTRVSLTVHLKLTTTTNDTSLTMDRWCTGIPQVAVSSSEKLFAVELLHPGLDRFKEAERSLNTAEEDGFCKRLHQIGASRWASRAEWSGAPLGEGDTAKVAKIVETGWLIQILINNILNETIFLFNFETF